MKYFEEANRLYKEKDYPAAIEMYQVAIENNDHKASALYNSATCFIKLKNYDTAIKLFNHAIALKKESKYFFNLGYCYGMTGDFKKALISFNTSWALNPEDMQCKEAIDLLLKRLNRR